MVDKIITTLAEKVADPTPAVDNTAKLFDAFVSTIGKAWTLFTLNSQHAIDWFAQNPLFLLPIAVAFVFMVFAWIRGLFKF